MDRNRIYLDYNATAPLLTEARERMIAAMALPGNPSSVHSEGRKARAIVEAARASVARLAGGAPEHVVFTSGATEAAATVLSPRYTMGRTAATISTLFVSAVEHPCVLGGGRFPTDRRIVVDVDENGIVDLDLLERHLRAHDRATGLAMVSIMYANNETGVIQPIGEIGTLVKSFGGVFVVDAVQAAGRIPIDINALGIDFLLLSSHKMGGAKGAGAFVGTGEMLMPVPLIPGGGQERGHRSGTENPVAIAGFGAAAEHALGDAEDTHRIRELRDSMEAGLRALAPDLVIHGETVARLPNTSFFALPGLKAETAQIAFDLEGVAVSSGSACSSGKVGPSHVLAAMGQDADLGALRVSLGPATRPQDIDGFLARFARINAKRTGR